MLAIAACSEEESTSFVPYDQPADHTLLMYMEGDNNLSALIENNVLQAHRAIRDSVASGKLNLVVYKDNKKNKDNLPKLYWVHGNMQHGLDTVMIKQWTEEVDSDDPNFIADVLKTTFSKFDSSIKGLVLASHASSWAPLVSNRTYSAPRPAYGYDQDTPSTTGSCELWDLAEALLQGPKLDYIIMDCCHMGNAEVAYELRDVTHYMVAGATETQGAGMPYLNAVTRLAKCKSVSDLHAALDYAAHCYFNENAPYNGSTKLGATTAVYDLTAMQQLASAYRALVQSNTDRLYQLANSDAQAIDALLNEFQPYGREYSSANGSIHYKYYFYDLKDIISWLGTNNASAAAQAQSALNQIVLKEYHSSQFWAINIGRSCGMGVTLPEALVLAKDKGYSHYFTPFSYTKLQSAYHRCAWGAMLGY